MTKEYGEVRKELSGPEAAPYMGIARNLLGIMKNMMRLGNLMQNQMIRTLEDGTQIVVTSIFGQDKIMINRPVKAGVLTSHERLSVESNSYIYFWKTLDGIYRLEGKKPPELIITSDTLLTRSFSDISPDGSHVLGGGSQGWYWSRASGIVDVPEMAALGRSTLEGGIFVGRDLNGDTALYSKKHGVEVIGSPMASYGISNDGTVVAMGLSGGTTGDADVTLWKKGKGSSVIANFEVNGISGDGTVVFGYKTIQLSPFVTIRKGAIWTAKTGTILIDAPSGFAGLRFSASSEDGTVIVGDIVDGVDIVTVINTVVWTKKTGVVVIDTTAVGANAGTTVTLDGVEAVGSFGSGSARPYKWSKKTGTQPLSSGSAIFGTARVGTKTTRIETEQ